jgi:HEAT repeat protein
VRRAHYEGFLRNVAVALGNWGDEATVPGLVARLDDPSPLVRGHVAWALGRAGTGSARQALERRRAEETDPWVREEIALALGESVQATAPEPKVGRRSPAPERLPERSSNAPLSRASADVPPP